MLGCETRFLTKWAFTLFCLIAFPQKGLTQGWLMIEARDLPIQCVRPLDCTSQGNLVMRNLFHFPRHERQILVQTLNSLATIRGVPEVGLGQTMVSSAEHISVLHALPKADRLATLIDHPGVFFDSTRLDGNIQTAEFSPIVRRELTNAGVRFLTEDEWQATPGRPTLSVRYKPRTESAGCIIPFEVSLSISEESVMVRNPAIKVSGSAWSGKAKENLANTNYTPISALEQVLKSFVTDWKSQNP